MSDQTYEKLLDAIIKHENTTVKTLLSGGINIPLSPLCLIVAVNVNNIDILNVLGDFGADFNVVNENGQNLLYRPVVDGNYTMTKFLLDKGLSPNHIDNNGNSLFKHISFYPSTSKYVPIINLLLNYGCNVDTTLMLNLTVYYDDYETTKLLLDAGANPNGFDLKNIPLHETFYKPNYDLFDLLLEYNCDINLQDSVGKTLLMKALTNDIQYIIDKLLPLSNKINVGVPLDIDMKDNNGKSALFYVRNTNQLEKLLMYGANINSQDNNGHTFLFDMCCKVNLTDNDLLLVESLLKYGADINLSTPDDTPLMIGCIGGNIKLINLLFSYKANPNITVSRNLTALELIRRVIDLGVNIEKYLPIEKMLTTYTLQYN